MRSVELERVLICQAGFSRRKSNANQLLVVRRDSNEKVNGGKAQPAWFLVAFL